jgi:hypothetical protein
MFRPCPSPCRKGNGESCTLQTAHCTLHTYPIPPHLLHASPSLCTPPTTASSSTQVHALPCRGLDGPFREVDGSAGDTALTSSGAQYQSRPQHARTHPSRITHQLADAPFPPPQSHACSRYMVRSTERPSSTTASRPHLHPGSLTEEETIIREEGRRRHTTQPE